MTRKLILIGMVSTIAAAIWATPAWAPTVGQPPAPGYPPCTKVGGDGRDIIRGTNHRDVICPDLANDVVYGKGGPDVIMGGLGRDKLFGGTGDDEFHAWGGNDRIWGEEGDDQMNGETGNDTIVGGPGRDEFIGSSGNDCFYSLDGEVDVLKGMIGQDHHESDPTDVLQGSTESAADCYGPA